MKNTFDTISRKLIRAELTAKGARDLDLAEAILSTKLRFDADTGEHVGIERDGTDRINLHAPGCPSMNLSDVLAETIKSRPDLFDSKSTVPEGLGQASSVNPFAQGPHRNLTAAMALYSVDPGLAEKLAAEAGIILGLDR